MKKFPRRALPFLIAFLCSSITGALDPRNPVSLCDRFIAENEQKNCQEKMQKMKPDWYVAGVCDKLYSDASFLECMSLASEAMIQPRSLDACGKTELSDEDRIFCIQKLASDQHAKNSNRMPASTKKERP